MNRKRALGQSEYVRAWPNSISERQNKINAQHMDLLYVHPQSHDHNKNRKKAFRQYG